MPNLGRLRLPKVSWSGVPKPPGRSASFKAKPVRPRIPRPAGRSPAFKAKPSRTGSAIPGTSALSGLGKNGSMFRRSGGGGERASGGKIQKRRRRGRYWLILSLVLILAVLQGLRYVEQHLRPPIIHLAQIRVKQIATESINKAITSQVADGGDAEALIDWKSDKEGKISGFMLNYKEHMRITSQAAQVIQSTLQELHNRTEYIPLGQALGSPLIASFGPDVPIKIEPQGAVKVELNTRQKNAGINMILVEVYIHIVTEVAVVIPFDMEPQVVDTEIPVSYLMVVGDVPMYYYDNQGQPVGENGSNAPGIAIPAPSVSGETSGNGKDNPVKEEVGDGEEQNSGNVSVPPASGNSPGDSGSSGNAGNAGNSETGGTGGGE